MREVLNSHLSFYFLLIIFNLDLSAANNGPYLKNKELCGISYGLKVDEYVSCKDSDIINLIKAKNAEANETLLKRLIEHEEEFNKLPENKKIARNYRIKFKIGSDQYYYHLYDSFISSNKLIFSKTNNHYSSAFAYIIAAVKFDNSEALLEILNYYNSKYLYYLAARYSYFYKEDVGFLKKLGRDKVLEACLFDDYLLQAIPHLNFTKDEKIVFLNKLNDMAIYEYKHYINGGIYTHNKFSKNLFYRAKRFIRAGFPVNEVMSALTNRYEISVELNERDMKFLYGNNYSAIKEEVRQGKGFIPLMHFARYGTDKFINNYLFELIPYLSNNETNNIKDEVVKSLLENKNFRSHSKFTQIFKMKFSDGSSVLDYAWKNRLYRSFFHFPLDGESRKDIKQIDVKTDDISAMIQNIIKSVSDVYFGSHYLIRYTNLEKKFASNIAYKEIQSLIGIYEDRTNKGFNINKYKSYDIKKYDDIARVSESFKEINKNIYDKVSNYITNKSIKTNNDVWFIPGGNKSLDILGIPSRVLRFNDDKGREFSQSSFEILCLDENLKPIDVLKAELNQAKGRVKHLENVYVKSLVNQFSWKDCRYMYKVKNVKEIEKFILGKTQKIIVKRYLKLNDNVDLYKSNKTSIKLVSSKNDVSIHFDFIDNRYPVKMRLNCEKSSLDHSEFICNEAPIIFKIGDIDNDGLTDFILSYPPVEGNDYGYSGLLRTNGGSNKFVSLNYWK